MCKKRAPRIRSRRTLNNTQLNKSSLLGHDRMVCKKFELKSFKLMDRPSKKGATESRSFSFNFQIGRDGFCR
jgi:hypothetical protein